MQPQLRPLMLVARQQARALEDAARRGANNDLDATSAAPTVVERPRPRPPQLYTAAPNLGRRVVGPPGPPPTCGLPPHPPRSPTQVTYNVNERIERARALRAREEACARPPVAAVQRGSPRPPSSDLPYLARAQTAQQQQQRVIEALRVQGSALPSVLRQIERGQPVMVPPRRSSLEANKKLPPFK